VNKQWIFKLLVVTLVTVSPSILAQVTSLTEARPTQWEKIAEKNQIILYEGNIEKDGAVPLKGHVVIERPIAQVVALMAHSQDKKQWLPAVDKIEVMDRPNDYQQSEYFLVKMPFIVSNRTIVLTSVAQVSSDQSEVVVKVYSDGQYPEKNKNYVRASMPFGEVRLKSIDEGKRTIVAGIFYTNPEGMIPNWIVKRFTREFVFESLLKLRELAHRDIVKDSEINRYANLIQSYHQHNRTISSK
jgi:hypothetical protein